MGLNSFCGWNSFIQSKLANSGSLFVFVALSALLPGETGTAELDRSGAKPAQTTNSQVRGTQFLLRLNSFISFSNSGEERKLANSGSLFANSGG